MWLVLPPRDRGCTECVSLLCADGCNKLSSKSSVLRRVHPVVVTLAMRSSATQQPLAILEQATATMP